MRRSLVWIAVVVMIFGMDAAWADSQGVLDSSGRQDPVEEMMGKYNLQPAFGKLGRGLSNALMGWLEVPLNVGQRYSAADTVGSSLTGFAIGAFKGLVRTGVGIYETVTFFIPYPEHYRSILPTLEYFQKTGKREKLPLE